MGKPKAKKQSSTYYKQCTFESPSEQGKTCQTAWVPEKFAVAGKKVYFGKKSKGPNQIWEVIAAGTKRISHEYLSEHERDYKTQRDASDI